MNALIDDLRQIPNQPIDQKPSIRRELDSFFGNIQEGMKPYAVSEIASDDSDGVLGTDLKEKDGFLMGMGREWRYE